MLDEHIGEGKILERLWRFVLDVLCFCFSFAQFGVCSIFVINSSFSLREVWPRQLNLKEIFPMLFLVKVLIRCRFYSSALGFLNVIMIRN